MGALSIKDWEATFGECARVWRDVRRMCSVKGAHDSPALMALLLSARKSREGIRSLLGFPVLVAQLLTTSLAVRPSGRVALPYMNWSSAGRL